MRAFEEVQCLVLLMEEFCELSEPLFASTDERLPVAELWSGVSRVRRHLRSASCSSETVSIKCGKERAITVLIWQFHSFLYSWTRPLGREDGQPSDVILL